MDRGVWQAIAHVHYYKRPDRDLPHLCLEYRMPKKNTVYQIITISFILSAFFIIQKALSWPIHSVNILIKALPGTSRSQSSHSQAFQNLT